MIGASIVGAVYLAVSLTALIAQNSARRKLRGQPPASRDGGLAYRGLVRTSRVRVALALLYVALGVASTTGDLGQIPSLAVYTVTAVVWMRVSRADVALRLRMDGRPRTGRHRRT